MVDRTVHVAVPETVTGVYEAWIRVPIRPAYYNHPLNPLRLALTESLWKAIGTLDCAHVDEMYEIVDPGVSSLSALELETRYGLRLDSDYGWTEEVHRLLVYVGDGRQEGLTHDG